MNVEQENFLPRQFPVGPAAAKMIGHEIVLIARAKSALTTTASARYVPLGLCGLRRLAPGEQNFLDGFIETDLHSEPPATRAIAAVIAAQPPIGWQTPCSYSRKLRMLNRLGQRNGDMPRYFDWKQNASRTRSSVKNRFR